MSSTAVSKSALHLPQLRIVVGAYVGLTKPRILELLLITTVPAMAVAAGGWPGIGTVVATLIGGTLSAGGANALNSYYDRDIDHLMGRTAGRPLPTHQVEPEAAWVFGWALGLAGLGWLWLTTNPLAGLLSFAALLFYVYVYTIALKRSTTQNIVIGGAAGAAPALVGWAAVTGSLALPAWILFAVVFCWTPAHFWALAVRYRDDYAAAGVPMLPVVQGISETTPKIAVYAGLTVLFSLALIPTAGMGWLYLVASVGLGAWFFHQAVSVHLHPDRAMLLFTRSNIYLAALFAAAFADRMV